MSKPIRSYPIAQQPEVITRRILGKTLGLGFVSAVAALRNRTRYQIQVSEGEATKLLDKVGKK